MTDKLSETRDDGLTEAEAEAVEALSEAAATCDPPAPIEEQTPPGSFFPE